MAYAHDDDLDFLRVCKDEDLHDLVKTLTHDKDGLLRVTEELTDRDLYKKYYPKHSHYWREIAGELQCFGANSIATIFRGGKGVLYQEILTDVVKKYKVKINSNMSVEEIEDELFLKVFNDALNNMTESELNETYKYLDIPKGTPLNAKNAYSAFRTLFKLGGFKSYQYSVIVVNTVAKTLLGRGLSFAANASLTRGLAIMTGPVGMSISAAWTIIDLSGSAYRVTIPSVFIIAALRKKYKDEYTAYCNENKKHLSDPLSKGLIELTKFLNRARQK